MCLAGGRVNPNQPAVVEATRCGEDRHPLTRFPTSLTTNSARTTFTHYYRYFLHAFPSPLSCIHNLNSCHKQKATSRRVSVLEHTHTHTSYTSHSTSLRHNQDFHQCHRSWTKHHSPSIWRDENLPTLFSNMTLDDLYRLPSNVYEVHITRFVHFCCPLSGLHCFKGKK